MSEVKEETEEETRILTQVTSLLLEETRSVKEKEKEIFVSRPETATVVLPPQEFHRMSVSRQLLGAVLLVILSLGLIIFIVSRQGSRLPPQKTVVLTPPVAPPPPPPVATEPRPPEAAPPPIKQDQVIAALEQKKEKPVKNGYLSVQAIPWGYVTVDGGSRRWETPLRRLALKSGPHTIKVLYEPDGSFVSSDLKIVAADEIVCVANFREGKKIRCGH